MGLTDLEIELLTERYRREQDRYEKLAGLVARTLSKRIVATLPHITTFRSKRPESLKGKLERDRGDHEFSVVDKRFEPGLKDLAGARVLVYRPDHVAGVCDAIAAMFDLFDPNDDRFKRSFVDPNGYLAEHRVVVLRDEQIAADPAHANLRGIPCEVQVASVGDHVWNELQHDIQFKIPHGKPNAIQKELLTTLRGQLNEVRATVVRLMDATDRQRAEAVAEVENVRQLDDALFKIYGERIGGDMERLLELLEHVMRDPTLRGLQTVLDPKELPEARRRLVEAKHDADDHDAAVIVAALWPTYGADFPERTSRWPGRKGPFAKAVAALEKRYPKGKV